MDCRSNVDGGVDVMRAAVKPWPAVISSDLRLHCQKLTAETPRSVHRTNLTCLTAVALLVTGMGRPVLSYLLPLMSENVNQHSPRPIAHNAMYDFVDSIVD